MITQIDVLSTRQKSTASAYLMDCLRGSPFFQRLGDGFPESGDFRLITSSAPPTEQDLRWGWGGSSSGQLFFQEVLEYLQETPDAVVLFEDAVSLPGDAFLASRAHPPYWLYGSRLFWPVLGKGLSCETVEQTMAWSAAIHVLAVFSLLPVNFSKEAEITVLPSESLDQVASSICRIAVDVFDGEGYLVWEKKTGVR